MSRAIACLLVVGVFLASLGSAEAQDKKKKKSGAAGKITKIDAEKGLLTIKTAGKKGEERTFMVTKDTVVTEIKGEDKVEVKADKVADLLKKEQFKEGVNVAIEAGEKGDKDEYAPAKSITIGAPKKKKDK